MARVEINGITLNVEVAGAGPPLLVLHGFTGSVATWHEHLPAFTRHNRVIAVDLIGHGASDAPRDAARYSMAHCACDLLAVCHHLHAEHFALLGYSMGARLALCLAAAAPERISALVLESGSPGLADSAERAARRASDEALAIRIEREGVEAFVAAWETLPLFASQRTLPPQVRKRLRMQRLRNSPLGLANSLRGMGLGAQESLWGRLGEITAPTLLIAGALDHKFQNIAQEMVKQLPRVELGIVPDGGHAAHLERPDVFNGLVMEFVGTHSSRRTVACL